MTELGDFIGYAVLDRFEECFGFVENECFVASTMISAQAFSLDSMSDDNQILEVSFGDLLTDFGCSGGGYAMESNAFTRFQLIAAQNNLEFSRETRPMFDLVFVELTTKT